MSQSNSEYHRQYYEKNKEVIKNRAIAKNRELSTQLVVCECGRQISMVCMARHLKSKIHKRFLETKPSKIFKYSNGTLNLIEDNLPSPNSSLTPVATNEVRRP